MNCECTSPALTTFNRSFCHRCGKRPQGVKGPECCLVGEPRSGSQQDGAEVLREASGVGKTVEQSLCPTCAGEGILDDWVHGNLYTSPCWECGGTGQRSGLSNADVDAPAVNATPIQNQTP